MDATCAEAIGLSRADQIWNVPTAKLAKRHALSDLVLGKVCTKQSAGF